MSDAQQAPIDKVVTEEPPRDDPPQDTPPDYEELARPMGWKPKQDYKGDPARFIDAETFYKNGQVVLPIVKAEARALREEVERLKKNQKEFGRIAEATRQREVAELTTQLEQAKAARVQAVNDSDGAAFAAADDAVKTTEQAISKSTTKPADEPPLDPVFDGWVADNPWYNDPDVQADCDLLTRRMIAPGGKYAHLRGKGRELYDAIGAEYQRRQKIIKGESNADLERPGPARGGRGSGDLSPRQATKRSYENLQPEYKQACDSMYREFYGGSDSKPKVEKWRESYVADCDDTAFK